MSTRLLALVAELGAELASASDADAVIAVLLEGLERKLEMAHTHLMLVDEGSPELFTVATHGFSPSGVGSEEPVGEGVWGKVAERRLPFRIGNLRREMFYARTARIQSERAGDGRLTRVVELPGLLDVQSIVAVPLVTRGVLIGVLGAQSQLPSAFGVAAEQALIILSTVAAQALFAFRDPDESVDADDEIPPPPPSSAHGKRRLARYYRNDDSVFVDHEYIIKGLAGRILWSLLRAHAEGRRTFTNKELRVDPTLALPPIADNLESRLILLRHRLEEKAPFMRIERRGRGRFSFEILDEIEIREA